jgi:hypothetical protein
MSGIFDIFRKKSGQKSLFDAFPSGGMIPATPPQPKEKRDLFAFLDPNAATASPKGKSLIQRLLPPLPSFPSEKGLPSEVIPARESAPAAPIAQWGEMFSRPTKEEPPVSKMFEKMMKAQEPPPKYVLINPSSPPETPVRPHGLPASSKPVTEWTFPSAGQLAEHFHLTMKLPEIFSEIRAIRETPEFKKDQLIYSWQGVPMMIPIDPVVYREKYSDWANFYGIPWGVIQMYVDVPPEYQKEGDDALWNNVLSPLNSLLPEAFERMKPPDLPGFFNVSFTEPAGEYWLYYIEPKLEGTIPPPGGFGGA